MIGIHFCGAAATVTALLLFFAGWQVRRNRSMARDFAMAMSAFSSTAIAMSAAWIVSSSNRGIREDIEIGAVMVGLLCLSFGGMAIGFIIDHPHHHNKDS
jgi:hypothetical protein